MSKVILIFSQNLYQYVSMNTKNQILIVLTVWLLLNILVFN